MQCVTYMHHKGGSPGPGQHACRDTLSAQNREASMPGVAPSPPLLAMLSLQGFRRADPRCSSKSLMAGVADKPPTDNRAGQRPRTARAALPRRWRLAEPKRLDPDNLCPKMAQALARHSDIRLTFGVYTHVELPRPDDGDWVAAGAPPRKRWHRQVIRHQGLPDWSLSRCRRFTSVGG